MVKKTATRKLFPTQNDLPAGPRGQLVDLLNARLADLIDLQLQAKFAHWNVKGPQFQALHELFDKVSADVSLFVDDVAERAVQLGGVAEGSAHVVARRSSLRPYPAVADGRDHVRALSAAIGAAGREVRAAIDRAAGLGDADAADLFTEVSRGLDKLLWFVEAHQQ